MRELDRCEVDVDWEKVKTLPRVCLIPPEGMSQARDSEPLYPFSVLSRLSISQEEYKRDKIYGFS